MGLDRTSMVTLYGPNIQLIDNKQCKSNEKLIDEDMLAANGDKSYHQHAMRHHVAFTSTIPPNDLTSGSRKRKRDCIVSPLATSAAMQQHRGSGDEDEEDDYEQLEVDEEELVDDEYADEMLGYGLDYDDDEQQQQRVVYGNEDDDELTVQDNHHEDEDEVYECVDDGADVTDATATDHYVDDEDDECVDVDVDE